MRKLIYLLPNFLMLSVSAQVSDFNILNCDSFPSFVKKVTMNGYLVTDAGEKHEPMSSQYYELDSTGSWLIHIETFSDGDESHDTVYYNPVTRTRTIRRSNDFEPGSTIIVYNKDSTVKSIFVNPDQRDDQLTEFEYDDDKRVISKTVTFEEYKVVEDYLYDETGRLLNLKRSSSAVGSKKLQLDYEERYNYQPNQNEYVMYALYYGAGDQVRTRDTTFFMFNDQHQLAQKIASTDNGKAKALTTYEYDEKGRVVHKHEELTSKQTEARITNVIIEYDSMGYYHFYSEEETKYSFSNRWTTTYNERGLPVQSYYQTAAEVFYYEWIYEYR